MADTAVDIPQKLQAEGDALLRDFLAAHHAPCPLCGHDLFGVTAARCPRCGQSVGLTIAGTQADPYLTAYAILLIVAFLNTGLALLLYALLARFGWFDYPWAAPPLRASLVTLALVFFLASPLILAGVLLLRRRFLRQRRAAQWIEAACALALTAACYAFAFVH